MKPNRALALAERVQTAILTVRDRRVILDADLAMLYGVPTKVLNQAVKRNAERFPVDFMFRLTRREKQEVVTNCDHLRGLRYSPVLPLAFTEHGAVMAANLLNSPRAIGISVEVVRAFVRLRELLATHKDLTRRIDALEAKFDRQFAVVFDAIRALIEPPDEPSTRKPVGYHTELAG